jgi:uncharacterized membrane protein YkvA (DUF1232 family)
LHGLLIGLAGAAGLWLVALGLLFLFGRRLAARELATLLPHLIGLFRGLIRDPRVSRGSKAWLVVGVAWLASPIDLVPEFIPVLGPLDDAVVAVLILRHVVRRAGPEVVADHWKGDPSTLRRLLRLAGVRSASGASGESSASGASVPGAL